MKHIIKKPDLIKLVGVSLQSPQSPGKTGWQLCFFILLILLDLFLLKDFKLFGVVVLTILFIALSILTNGKTGSASSNKKDLF